MRLLLSPSEPLSPFALLLLSFCSPFDYTKLTTENHSLVKWIGEKTPSAVEPIIPGAKCITPSLFSLSSLPPFPSPLLPLESMAKKRYHNHKGWKRRHDFTLLPLRQHRRLRGILPSWLPHQKRIHRSIHPSSPLPLPPLPPPLPLPLSPSLFSSF